MWHQKIFGITNRMLEGSLKGTVLHINLERYKIITTLLLRPGVQRGGWLTLPSERDPRARLHGTFVRGKVG